MKILCLFGNECALELFQWLEREGHQIVMKSDKLEVQWCREQAFDLTVSYTYRYILSKDLIFSLNNNVVNIHNSILPFNRGANPNLWSIVEKTPRGVSLHYVDEGLDKGYIIAQSFVNDSEGETLSSSYNNLDRVAKKLFKEAFRYYEFWPQLKKVAVGNGTYHALKDGEMFNNCIETYDTTVDEFLKKIDNCRKSH